MRTKKPPGLIALGMKSPECHIMPPILLDKGDTVTCDSYSSLLKTTMEPWTRSLPNRAPILHQQDYVFKSLGCPGHAFPVGGQERMTTQCETFGAWQVRCACQTWSGQSSCIPMSMTNKGFGTGGLSLRLHLSADREGMLRCKDISLFITHSWSATWKR